jgi:hypothetical protein
MMATPGKEVRFDDQGRDSYATPSKEKKTPTPSFRSNQRSVNEELAYQDEIQNIVNSAMRSHGRKTGQSPNLD